MKIFKTPEERDAAFTSTFYGSNSGRKVLEFLIETYYNTQSYVRESNEHTFFNEGRRSLVAEIMKYSKPKE